MRLRIGEVLVADGAVTTESVVRALGYQKRAIEPFRLGSILLGWDLLAEEALLAGLARFHHCPSVTWEALSLASRKAVESLPPDRAIKLGGFPYAIDAGRIRVAFSNPSNLLGVDEIAQVAGKPILPAVTTEVGLALAFKKFYGHPVPPQLKSIALKLARQRTTPVAAIPIVRAAEAAPAASPRSAGPPEWPFWTPEEAPERPRVVLGAGVPWLAAGAAPENGPVPISSDPAEARRRDQIAAPVLEILLAEFPRVVVFGVGKSSIAGWTGRGPGLSPEAVSNLRVPARGENALADVASSGVPHFGLVDADRLPRGLDADGTARECAIFPIRVLDSVAGVLYADRMSAPMPFEDFATLARGAASAANLLSRFLGTEEIG